MYEKKSSMKEMTAGEKQLHISFIFSSISIPPRKEKSLPLFEAKPGHSRKMCEASQIALQKCWVLPRVKPHEKSMSGQ